ncbi:hypothetical protein CCP1ISM_250007 [Azospirillaceae bacterium]
MKVNYRNEYKLFKKELADNGKENARVTMSSLVLSVPINNASNSYQFPVLESDAPGVPQIPDEIRLNQNDLFSMYEVGIFLRAELIKLGPPDTTVSYFLSSSPIELDRENIAFERLYEGKLQWNVNNVTWLDNWDVRKHQYKGVTQWQNFSAGLPFTTFPANNYEDSGMIPFIPKLNISGAKKNFPVIVLPEAINPLPPASGIITPTGNLTLNISHIVVVLRGLLAQNCADFQTRDSAIRQQKPSIKKKFGK